VANIYDDFLDNGVKSLGRISLTISKAGSYTMSGVFGGPGGTIRTIQTGSIDSLGVFTFRFHNSPGETTMRFSLTEDIAPGGPIPVSVVGADKKHAFKMHRPAGVRGLNGRRFTVADKDGAGGWAVFNVRSGGSLLISGRVAGGFPFAAGGYLDGRSFNFFSGRYGSLASMLENPRVVSGRVELESTGDLPMQGQGFINYGTDFAASGSARFDTVVSAFSPLGKADSWFNYGAGLGNVTLSIPNPESSGNVLATGTAYLGTRDKAVVTAPFTALNFQRKNTDTAQMGTFSGSVTIANEKRPFSGVIMQNTNEAVGFVDGTTPARITIKP
jgi:hypothetical protein